VERESIRQISEENLRAMEAFSYLAGAEGSLYTPEEIAAFAVDCGLDRHEAFLSLLAAACGLEPDRKREDRRLIERYFRPALRPLFPDAYRQNPYALRIRFPEKTRGAWQLCRRQYAPYQVVPCGDTLLLPDGREIPPLGYFPESFSFPAVLENGREWMTVTPNEIETMAPAVSASQGKAAVFGLGLGYFAFMIAEKESVSAVTIVERDESVIQLFQKELLPQFPHREKIRIVKADAFDYLSGPMKKERFDFAFFDLWHDVSDGLPLYLRLRQEESRVPETVCAYWIEQSLLVFLRSLILDDQSSHAGRLDRLFPLGNPSLEDVRRLAPQIDLGDIR